MAITAERRSASEGNPPLRQSAVSHTDSRPDRRSRPTATTTSCSTTSRRKSGKTRGSRACCAKSSRSRATTRTLPPGIHPLRAGQAALRAGRVPATAADLRPAVQVWLRLTKEAADRGRSLPGRHADHARRRRVHHQRRRARRGQPVAPQPGRRLRHRDRSRGERKLHSCRIIPERGSWIELNVTRKKDTLAVRIDQSGKFSVMTLLRAMDPKYGRDADLAARLLRDEQEKIVDGRSVAQDRRQDRRRRHRLSRRQRAGRRNASSKCGQKITKNAAETDLHLRA